MATLTNDDVLKLARLARIDLTDAEVEKFAAEFNAILEYVAQLQAVNVDGLKPTSQVTGLTNVMRKDEELDYGYKAAKLLENLPRLQDDHIKVNKMIG